MDKKRGRPVTRTEPTKPVRVRESLLAELKALRRPGERIEDVIERLIVKGEE